MTTTEISNTADIIDSRDVIARIEDLETALEAVDAEKMTQAETELAEELTVLKKLAADGESFGDWKHGLTLIHDDYFETYVQEYACDIGAISNATDWPITCIDWEEAADELQNDFSQLDFDGQRYWTQS